MHYLLLLLITWLVNGSIKFAVNFACKRTQAFALIGYGGFPSTHTAMVTSLLSYVGFLHGFDHPAIAALLGLLWVVVTDARSLRMRIGEHARHLNQLDGCFAHRERIGHKLHEIIGGAAVGFCIGWLLYMLNIS